MIWRFRKSLEDCVKIYLAAYDLEIIALERIKALPEGLFELDWSAGDEVEKDYFFVITCRKKDSHELTFYLKMTLLLGLFAIRFKSYVLEAKRMKRFDMTKYFEKLD